MGHRLTEMFRTRAVPDRLNNAGREEREALRRAVTVKTTQRRTRRLETHRLFQCLPCHIMPRDLHLVAGACQANRRQQIETFRPRKTPVSPHRADNCFTSGNRRPHVNQREKACPSGNASTRTPVVKACTWEPQQSNICTSMIKNLSFSKQAASQKQHQ